jgi:RNA polymerase sigma-70 factor (ECF subfamily)
MSEPVPPSSFVAPADFGQAVLRHRDAAYNLARWLMHHPQDAEDCVQEAFLRAYQAFARFRGGDGRAWLLTIVRNLCYTRLRGYRREVTLETLDENTPDAEAASGHIPWQQAIARELLPRALELLPVEAREIIVLHEIEGMAYKDIATVMDLPLGTVMSRLARARQKLHAQLQQLLQKDLSHGL